MRNLKEITWFSLIFTLCIIPYTLYPSANCVAASDQIQLDLGTNKELEDEFAMLEEDQSVTIASKMGEDVSKAPSIITVITAEEIENMGARTLTDILLIVPGFDIKKDASFGMVEYGSRGIRASHTKIRVSVDGHSLNMPLDGSAAVFFFYI